MTTQFNNRINIFRKASKLVMSTYAQSVDIYRPRFTNDDVVPARVYDKLATTKAVFRPLNTNKIVNLNRREPFDGLDFVKNDVSISVYLPFGLDIRTDPVQNDSSSGADEVELVGYSTYAKFSAVINGTNLNVVSNIIHSPLIGQNITGLGITAGTKIIAQVDDNNWTLNNSLSIPIVIDIEGTMPIRYRIIQIVQKSINYADYNELLGRFISGMQ